MLCLRHYEKVAKMFSIYVFPDPLASVKIRIEDLSVEERAMFEEKEVDSSIQQGSSLGGVGINKLVKG